MEWLQWIFNPPVVVSLKETAKIMLPVTGMLLGLVYITLIYWLQGGLSRLEHTKTILEDLLIANGKVLLDLLVGASLVSLFALLQIHLLIVLSFWVFGAIFFIDLLKVRELPVNSLLILIIIIDTDFTDLHRCYSPDY